MEFSTLRLKISYVFVKKDFLLFQEGACKARKTNISSPKSKKCLIFPRKGFYI